MVRLLLRNGANANHLDVHGYTALHLAASWGKLVEIFFN